MDTQPQELKLRNQIAITIARHLVCPNWCLTPIVLLSALHLLIAIWNKLLFLAKIVGKPNLANLPRSCWVHCLSWKVLARIVQRGREEVPSTLLPLLNALRTFLVTVSVTLLKPLLKSWPLALEPTNLILIRIVGTRAWCRMIRLGCLPMLRPTKLRVLRFLPTPRVTAHPRLDPPQIRDLMLDMAPLAGQEPWRTDRKKLVLVVPVLNVPRQGDLQTLAACAQSILTLRLRSSLLTVSAKDKALLPLWWLPQIVLGL